MTSSPLKPLLIVSAASLAASLCMPLAAAHPSFTPPSARAATLLRVADKPSPAASQTYKVGALVIATPWARATPGGAKIGGGYVKITNTGSEPDRLVGGTLTGASEVEVHEMSMQNDVMKMRHLPDGLEIKPGATVELKPGSYHLMFMQLKDGLKAGQRLKGTLVFQKAGTVEVEYSVAPLGAQSPDGAGGGGKAKGGHHHH
jgi:copper(I)-binding protein